MRLFQRDLRVVKHEVDGRRKDDGAATIAGFLLLAEKDDRSKAINEFLLLVRVSGLWR